ncbi:MAG: ATP synthase F1 subunit epsilon [Planctomycetaceae bacterium]|jgi:F-type H+-transporting ATPase subunit epsilon|nr:ATP synthase F1 subunit epsilon [Planctomycetaceae bacterium]
MKCIVVTPDKTVLDVEASFVALPLVDGEIGIGPKHTPIIGRLGYGELRIKSGSDTKAYYVESGFVEVLNDVVTLLTDSAIEASDIDLDSSQQVLTEALAKPAHNEALTTLKEQSVAAARAQRRIAQKRALQ